MSLLSLSHHLPDSSNSNQLTDSYPGILPIIQWLTSLERAPPPTRTLVTIERLQGWAMLAYYPLEHLAWLVGHAVLPAPTIFGGKARAGKGKRRGWTIEAGTLGVWSCRCWAVYVVLQFAHLREDMRLLRMRERAVGKMKVRNFKFFFSAFCLSTAL